MRAPNGRQAGRCASHPTRPGTAAARWSYRSAARRPPRRSSVEVAEHVVGRQLVQIVLLAQPLERLASDPPRLVPASSLISRVNAPRARPSSTGRPTPSPFQKGTLPGSPGAGVTRTRSCLDRLRCARRWHPAAPPHPRAPRRPSLRPARPRDDRRHARSWRAPRMVVSTGAVVSEEDREQPAVGDGAAGGDGDHARIAPCHDGAGDAGPRPRAA